LRLPITLPLDLYEALQKESRATGASLAGVVRLLVTEGLRRRGYKVSGQIKRGGKR
jgi:CopG antitoxin of type II toxin-antitoxin system